MRDGGVRVGAFRVRDVLYTKALLQTSALADSSNRLNRCSETIREGRGETQLGAPDAHLDRLDGDVELARGFRLSESAHQGEQQGLLVNRRKLGDGVIEMAQASQFEEVLLPFGLALGRLVRLGRFVEKERQDAASYGAPPRMIAAPVEKYSPQPTDERLSGIEAPQGEPGGDKRLLHDVIRFIGIPHVAAREAIQRCFVAQDQLFEGMRVALAGRDRERTILLLRIPGHGWSESSTRDTV